MTNISSHYPQSDSDMDELGLIEVEDDLFEFTLAELGEEDSVLNKNIQAIEMENRYKELGEKSLLEEFCRDLAMSFSCSSSRAGKSTIAWQQVQSWFQNKHREKQSKIASPSAPLQLVVDLSHTAASGNAVESTQISKGERAMDISELAFEAKSFKDNAWYDVASFLTYRVLSRGELEVRVRFAGFEKDQDEWINVRNGVRERSVPLESSECDKVKVGDLVLCYQEREYRAVYCDAHVLEVRRRIHDIEGCTCSFIVRYDDDNIEEKVDLERLCCRPIRYKSLVDMNYEEKMAIDEDSTRLSFLY